MKKIGLLVFVFYVNFLIAATPITHTYLAYQFLERYPFEEELDKKSFLLGNLFPDIRYLGGIKRDQTHFTGMTLVNVLEEPSPFVAGMKFHSFVDAERNRFIQEEGIYTRLIELNAPKDPSFLKFVEDELVFPLWNWEECLLCLQETVKDEEKWGVSQESVLRWHQILQTFFSLPPSFFLENHHANDNFGIPLTHAKAWSSLIKPTSEDVVIQEYVCKMLKYFGNAIQNSTL
ncbi:MULTISPECIES: hypothetical protein [Parachlamydia]|jgi:hypothetical protein|uniref:Uncharacterized protein n=1 Tax=Parachlamydia acanthamoebae (strain UV7) TaxID=765952 RepID=F8KW33_PARAV|nr:hypothetical protein [Parachlamydia acanthamoebae]EFB40327.1 hypothetical protein pah_c207o011 [Parachlamydia acanthamoebae str. Hall's coccus]CCB85399.1 putative uncharacterized protein [Parachlamydia acanthamoebae UV-7]